MRQCAAKCGFSQTSTQGSIVWVKAICVTAALIFLFNKIYSDTFWRSTAIALFKNKVMLNQEILIRLTAAIQDCLNKTQLLKSQAVSVHRYENSSQLRDIEKQIESIANLLHELTQCIPDKKLATKERTFYHELFEYGIRNRWKNMPDKFNTLFMERKASLNNKIVYDENSSNYLLHLNHVLKNDELEIKQFYDFLNYMFITKALDSCIDHVDMGNLVVKCYAKKLQYEFTRSSFNYDTPFYQLETSLSNLMSNMTAFYKQDEPNGELYEFLPLKFREDGLCFLFSFLATQGILAWNDFLNISHVKIDMKINYQFHDANARRKQ